ncbi:LLM class flavin-dependent oxidoreductase [Microbacterium sp. P05]|uniref:LLM class flavin-dependent oxidoreductase n=1 Tax=Microbacterium sp. P05 TaxID=3366948 RepID=UPI0037452298
MQLGVYSFGAIARDPDTGQLATTAQATRNLLEAVRLADEVGLDYFGIGEHHTHLMPASAASTILAAAASVTSRILLGSSVTVLSTEDPVRVYEQFATLDALSHGRAEITAGRGSSTESFPLFGFDLRDYDQLYAEKLELLLKINESERVTWSGTTRPALDNALVVPRPDAGHLPIWLGTGGSPRSSVRAGQLGLPVAYGVIGGQPERFSGLADLYRKAWAQSGHHPAQARVSVGNFGFIADTTQSAKDIFFEGWEETMTDAASRKGFSVPNRRRYEAETEIGAIFAGSPQRIAERIIALHSSLGHMRQFLQMDFGPISQRDFLHSIELLGTKVKPLVDADLGAEPADLRGSITGVMA